MTVSGQVPACRKVPHVFGEEVEWFGEYGEAGVRSLDFVPSILGIPGRSPQRGSPVLLIDRLPSLESRPEFNLSNHASTRFLACFLCFLIPIPVGKRDSKAHLSHHEANTSRPTVTDPFPSTLPVRGQGEMHPLIYPVTRSLAHLLTHSLTQSLPHSISHY